MCLNPDEDKGIGQAVSDLNAKLLKYSPDFWLIINQTPSEAMKSHDNGSSNIR